MPAPCAAPSTRAPSPRKELLPEMLVSAAMPPIATMRPDTTAATVAERSTELLSPPMNGSDACATCVGVAAPLASIQARPMRNASNPVADSVATVATTSDGAPASASGSSSAMAIQIMHLVCTRGCVR